jgi:hypothetical protein
MRRHFFSHASIIIQFSRHRAEISPCLPERGLWSMTRHTGWPGNDVPAGSPQEAPMAFFGKGSPHVVNMALIGSHQESPHCFYL